jgi:hypothetical protein
MSFKEHYFIQEAFANGSQQYNAVITKVLGTETVPEPNGTYIVGRDFTVTDKQDLDIFKRLYPITPPRKKESVENYTAGTRGSGNGEIALYWLLSKDADVIDTRDSDKPDLSVISAPGSPEAPIGVEIKAYNPGNTFLSLGRFESQKENISLLSIIFGISVLLGGSGTLKRPPSITTFKSEDIINAFKTFKHVIDNKQLHALSNQFSPIQSIYKQIEIVMKALNLDTANFTAEEGAAAMLKRFLVTKLSTKPGFGGYVLNITSNGVANFYQLTQERINELTTDELLQSVQAKSASLHINVKLLVPR